MMTFKCGMIRAGVYEYHNKCDVINLQPMTLKDVKTLEGIKGRSSNFGDDSSKAIVFKVRQGESKSVKKRVTTKYK